MSAVGSADPQALSSNGKRCTVVTNVMDLVLSSCSVILYIPSFYSLLALLGAVEYNHEDHRNSLSK